ncbi:MAG: uroporphyrinogen-III C-methyltransferase [Gammaproteobacteria bacterium]|nr:uroporphyrinogen-III C-methyltransferase [Gammaproteobacteria bacterium]
MADDKHDSVIEAATAKVAEPAVDTTATTAKADDGKHKTSHPRASGAHRTHSGGSKTAVTLAVLAILAAGASGGGMYWMWMQMQRLQQDEAQRAEGVVSSVRNDMAQLRTDIIASQQTLENQASQSVTQAVERLVEATSRQQRIEQEQEALRISLEGVYARIGNTNRGWMLREADYLLQVANHRLKLERDLPTAIEALRLADLRLKSVGDPALLNVRETIAAEIGSLERYSAPDRVAISSTLAALSTQIVELPLRGKWQPEAQRQASSAEQSHRFDELPSMIWESLKQLIVVRVNDRPVEPTLPPEKSAFLYQNLQLKLEQARLALMQHDTTLYRSNLHDTQRWIKGHFNMDAPPVRAMLAKLNELDVTELNPALPDISASLRTLHTVLPRIKADGSRIGGGNAFPPVAAAGGK